MHRVRVWLLATAVASLLASPLLPRVLRDMPDLEVYRDAGRRAAAGEPLYRTDEALPFKYLPAFALAVAPLAAMPLPAAKIVWFYLTIAAITGLLACSVGMLPARRHGAGLLVACTFLVMLKFYAREANLGQSNALMAVLVLTASSLAAAGRQVLSAVALVASAVIKPYTVALLPFALLRGLWPVAATGAVLLAAVLLVPSAIYGFDGNLELLGGLWQTTVGTTPAYLLNQDNVSLWAMYAKWFGVGRSAVLLAVGTTALLACLVVLVVVRGRRVAAAEFLDTSLLLTLMPLVSPQGWDYGLLLATPAVMLVFDRLAALPAVMRGAFIVACSALALSIYDVMGPEAYAAFMRTSALSVCGFVIVAALVVLRLRGDA